MSGQTTLTASVDRLGRNLARMGEGLKKAGKEYPRPYLSTLASHRGGLDRRTAIFLKSGWITSGAFVLSNLWDDPKLSRPATAIPDSRTAILQKAGWISSGTFMLSNMWDE